MKTKLRISTFLLHPESDHWLASLRIGFGLILVFYAWSLRGDWIELFGESRAGIVGREPFELLLSLQSPLIPRLGWIVVFGKELGISERASLTITWGVLLGAGVFLVLGLFSRSAAITAWFFQLAAAKSGGLFSYGADNFITIGLFYLMVAPLPDSYALDRMVRRRLALDPTRLVLQHRILQLHLCLVYFFGGLTKALGSGWWNGTNLWRALTMPPFNLLSPEFAASWGFLLPALGASIVFLELSYPILVWLKSARLVALLAICCMHISIGIFMGMYLFAMVMLVLNVSAFGPTKAEAKA